MRRGLLVLAALLVLVGGAAALRRAAGPGEEAVPTLLVRRGVFTRRVTAEGYLRASKVTPIVAPQADNSLKLAWLVPDGTPVKKGEVIVRFDPSEFDKQKSAGESERDTVDARSQRERVQTGAALQGRRLTAQLVQEELQRTQAFPRKDPEIFARNQIIEAQIDESLLQARRGHAEATRRLEGAVSQSKLELLALERRKAELEIDKAQKGLARMEVRAPHDGIVVFESDWRGNTPKVGDNVWSGQALASLPLLQEMEVEAYVLEADAGGLKAGCPAQVVIEAQPEVVYPGTIKRVDSLAKPRQRDVPVNYFAVTVALARTERERMRPGQRVRATLVLDEAQALTVPRQAVLERGGRRVVLRRNSDGRFAEAAVKLGATSPGLVVVTEGLQEGDRVALRDPELPAKAGTGKAPGAAPPSGAGAAVGGGR